jgi:hypothetical protein
MSNSIHQIVALLLVPGLVLTSVPRDSYLVSRSRCASRDACFMSFGSQAVVQPSLIIRSMKPIRASGLIRAAASETRNGHDVPPESVRNRENLPEFLRAVARRPALKSTQRIQMLSEREAAVLMEKISHRLHWPKPRKSFEFEVDNETYRVEMFDHGTRVGPLIFVDMTKLSDFQNEIRYRWNRADVMSVVRNWTTDRKRMLGRLLGPNRQNVFFVPPGSAMGDRGVSKHMIPMLIELLRHRRELEGVVVLNDGSGPGITPAVELGLGARGVVLINNSDLELTIDEAILGTRHWRAGTAGDFLNLEGDLTSGAFSSLFGKAVNSEAELPLVGVSDDVNGYAVMRFSHLARLRLLINMGYLPSEPDHQDKIKQFLSARFAVSKQTYENGVSGLVAVPTLMTPVIPFENPPEPFVIPVETHLNDRYGASLKWMRDSGLPLFRPTLLSYSAHAEDITAMVIGIPGLQVLSSENGRLPAFIFPHQFGLLDGLALNRPVHVVLSGGFLEDCLLRTFRDILNFQWMTGPQRVTYHFIADFIYHYSSEEFARHDLQEWLLKSRHQYEKYQRVSAQLFTDVVTYTGIVPEHYLDEFHIRQETTLIAFPKRASTEAVARTAELRWWTSKGRFLDFFRNRNRAEHRLVEVGA